MLKGNPLSYRNTHKEEESSYVTLDNGPFAYVTQTTNSEESTSKNHVLENVYFVTPILCVFCEDYIWGTGKIGVKCKGKTIIFVYNLNNYILNQFRERGK